MTHTSSAGTLPVISQTVTSKDGTPINILTVGAGPSLLIIPGALSLASDYASLASALADRFTAHIIERRGRGQSGALGPDYSIDKEREDVVAVQKKTGAQAIFGHSSGGLLAFEAARNNKGLTRMAVYEPGVSINGSIAVGWIPGYEAHLAKGERLEAFIEFIRYSGPSFMKIMPGWWLKLIVPRIIGAAEWGNMSPLLPNNLLEHKEAARLDNTYPNYREVLADTLLMAGSKSPKFREDNLRTLAGVLPCSEVKILPKLDHFAPTKGSPSDVAQAIKGYFLR